MDNAQPLENLTNLGLTRYEAAVYLALLERQDFTPSQLATHAKVPRQRIYDVLRVLCDRNLALERRSGKQRLFQAVDPAQALELAMSWTEASSTGRCCSSWTARRILRPAPSLSSSCPNAGSKDSESNGSRRLLHG